MNVFGPNAELPPDPLYFLHKKFDETREALKKDDILFGNPHMLKMKRLIRWEAPYDG